MRYAFVCLAMLLLIPGMGCPAVVYDGTVVLDPGIRYAHGDGGYDYLGGFLSFVDYADEGYYYDDGSYYGGGYYDDGSYDDGYYDDESYDDGYYEDDGWYE